MRELSSLPVAQDTLRVKKRRQDLEDKLMQIEDGLRIFSQPKVYVMNDDWEEEKRMCIIITWVSLF